MSAWNASDIPDQTARVAVVTGSNSGIGLETARELARKGATVVMACRSEARANEARGRILERQPEADVRVRSLELADLDQVRSFADRFRDEFSRLDLLINNAGIMGPPKSSTRQGFELQFGVNHLGHFALTGLLLDRLLDTPASRVVVVSSLSHRQGKMDFNDLDFDTRSYKAFAAYGQSKLSNLLFTRELARRLESRGADVIAAAAHPGWTSTNLQKHAGWIRVLNPVFGMQPPEGALPTLYAATAAGVESGRYYGPGGLFELGGPPAPAKSSAASQDRDAAARLWEVSEERSGVRYEALAV